METVDKVVDLSEIKEYAICARECKILSIGMIPRHMTSIRLAACELRTFPDVSGLLELETLSLPHNCIRFAEGNLLPDSLRTLDLSYNEIERFEVELPTRLESTCLSYNHLKAVPL
jgi:hypothetical protein